VDRRKIRDAQEARVRKLLGKAAAVTGAALMVAAGLLAAPAQASVGMILGNYDVLTDRYTRASWVWTAYLCIPSKDPNCRYISAAPRLKYYDYYEGETWLEGTRYNLTVNVVDGLACPGYNMPTRDTYSWDAYTLQGTIDSAYDVGCFNGPPGTQHWDFALQRL
jgi:hypothetical protein